MRKFTFFFALMVAMVTTAFAQVNYTPTNVTSTYKSRSDRNMTDVKVGDETYNLTSTEQGMCYVDGYENVTFTVKAGEEVEFKINTPGSWTHGVVYIDFDNNGFTAGVTENWKPTGDLVAYAFYNNNSYSDASGWNSVGDVVSGDNRNRPAIPNYTIPAETPAGEYRIRFKFDWCNIDPNGDADGKFSDFMANGGQIFDAKLVVADESTVEPEPEPDPDPDQPEVEGDGLVLELTASQIGTTYPYQLNEEDAAKVYDLTSLTVAVRVNTPATLNTRAALFAISDPTKAANTSAKGTDSYYVAYGMSNANIAYLASWVTGDRYSKGDVPANTNDAVLVYVLDKENNQWSTYLNGTLVQEPRNFGTYEIATPAMVKADYADANIYIGGGMNSAGAGEVFAGEITGVKVYEGALTAEEIAAITFATETPVVEPLTAAFNEEYATTTDYLTKIEIRFSENILRPFEENNVLAQNLDWLKDAEGNVVTIKYITVNGSLLTVEPETVVETPGEYTLTIPDGVVYNADETAVYAGGTFVITVAKGLEYQFYALDDNYTPGELGGTMTKVQNIAITSTGELAANEAEDAPKAYIMGENGSVAEATTLVGDLLGYGMPMVFLQFEEFTTPGIYQVVVPAGTFLVNGQANEEFTSEVFTIAAPKSIAIESVTPAEGVVEELSEIIVTFNENVFGSQDFAFDPESFLVVEGDESLDFASTKFNFVDDETLPLNQVKFVADTPVTAAGTYTLYCFDMYVYVNGTPKNFRTTYTWTISAPVVPTESHVIDLTFNKVSATEATVNVVESGVDATVITASVTANSNWKDLIADNATFPNASMLCPDKNTKDMTAGNEGIFTITLNNVPEGYSFNNITFTSAALNGTGAFQGDDVNAQLVNFTLKQGDVVLGTAENVKIKVNSNGGESVTLPFEIAEPYVATDGTLVLQLVLSVTEAKGCFYGLTKISINAEAPVTEPEPEPVVFGVSKVTPSEAVESFSEIVIEFTKNIVFEAPSAGGAGTGTSGTGTSGTGTSGTGTSGTGTSGTGTSGTGTSGTGTSGTGTGTGTTDVSMIKVKDANGGNVTTIWTSQAVVEGNTVTFKLESAITKNGVYTVEIPAGLIKSVDGEEYAGETFTFTVDAAPALTKPTGKTINVDAELAELTFEFDTNIAFAEGAAQTINVYNGTEVAGVAAATIAENVLTLTLAEAIAPEATTKYTVDLPANWIVKAGTDKAFAGKTFTVTVKVPFVVTNISLADGSEVEALESIVVEFNDNVDSYNTGKLVLVNTADNSEIALTATIDGKVLTLVPATVVYNGTYKLKGLNGLVNKSGAPVTNPSEPVFTVVGTSTAIDGVDAEAENAVIYDITGRRVNEITKGGIYIINGVKKLVK